MFLITIFIVNIILKVQDVSSTLAIYKRQDSNKQNFWIDKDEELDDNELDVLAVIVKDENLKNYDRRSGNDTRYS